MVIYGGFLPTLQHFFEEAQLIAKSESNLVLGLPTVPVFTGVTDAVDGRPSRPIEHFPDEIHGAGTGRQSAARPVKVPPLTAAYDNLPVTRGDIGIKGSLSEGSTFTTTHVNGRGWSSIRQFLRQLGTGSVLGHLGVFPSNTESRAPWDRAVNPRLTSVFLPSRPVIRSTKRKDGHFYDSPYPSRVSRLTAAPVYGTVGSPMIGPIMLTKVPGNAQTNVELLGPSASSALAQVGGWQSIKTRPVNDNTVPQVEVELGHKLRPKLGSKF
ncbi:hypothetical protein FB451DRAFT_1167620 [Mycena latifolia]|nr:hypothetical protein FB451DRAFT_1167620 [Mycena latifolia]